MNSQYCSPCSPVARVPVVITQEEEEDSDDDEDECEIVENQKENEEKAPICAALRKIMCGNVHAGRMLVGNDTTYDLGSLPTTRRRLFLTPKEKPTRKRKAVPIVSPQVDEDSQKWTTIIGSDRLKKDDSLLLLKMDALVAFLDNNFLCKHCLNPSPPLNGGRSDLQLILHTGVGAVQRLESSRT